MVRFGTGTTDGKEIMSVPIVDLEQDPDRVARELDDVCREVGFLQVVGHGVDRGIGDRAWNAAVRFFDLPLDERLAVAAPHPVYPYGYNAFSSEALSRSLGEAADADLKEVFNAGPVDAPTHRLAGPEEQVVYSPNLWPASFPEMEAAWTDYYRAMVSLSARMMSHFARALQLPPDFFDPSIDHSPSALRANNYPVQQQAPAPGQLRAGAHTDYGTITLLRQDTVGGLEVADGSGGWIGVESLPDAFVVNIGDLMARWTNDRWRSTMHRVVNPASAQIARQRRQSMPFFHNANWAAEVACLPTCLGAGERARYEPVLAGPYLMTKYRRATGAQAS